MRIPFIKTREERDFERRLRYRRIIRGLQNHLRRLEQHKERFQAMLRTALEVDNEVAAQRNARACAALAKRIERVHSQILAVEGIEAVGEMVRIDRDFAEFAREMGRAMAASVAAADLERFQADLERGLLRAEELDEMLDDMLGNLSDSLVGFGAPAGDEETEAAIGEATAAAEQEGKTDTDLQQRVARELAAIKESIGKD